MKPKRAKNDSETCGFGHYFSVSAELLPKNGNDR